MIIDTSAVIAILRDEPEAAAFATAIAEAATPRMSAATYLETAIVIDAAGDPIVSRATEEFLAVSRIEIEPVTRHHADLARAAYRDYGKGSGHPAQLNFGDCFAYALAAERREPLLFKGDDFVHTDLSPAI